MHLPGRLFSVRSKLLILIFILITLVRFLGLGYSDFYGDETKTFYLDKTVPAKLFFLQQRKGPLQFLVVWGVEKLSGGNDELLSRIPFAIAGVLSCAVLYMLVKKLWNHDAALVAVVLYGFNGFFVAFSRTIQYQSFLILFGLLAIYGGYRYTLALDAARKRLFLSLAGFSMGVAYLAHYDAVVFHVVLAVVLINHMRKDPKLVKEVLIWCGLPFLVTVVPFYSNYVFKGFFSDYTTDYMLRRMMGKGFNQNASWYTYWVYNPSYVWLGFATIPVFSKLRPNWRVDWVVWVWFASSFILYQLVFSNPGTHIQNYVLPFIILVSVSVIRLYRRLSGLSLNIYRGVLCGAFLTIIVQSFVLFTPQFSVGYPWTPNAISRDYHLFLYGFPYNRSWNDIQKYFSHVSGVRGVYTNDNDTIAQYYLRGFNYTPPGSNFLPQYFINVINNQEGQPADQEFLAKYDLQQSFYSSTGELNAEVYKLKPL